MKALVYLLSLVTSWSCWATASFPMHPALELTPGELCNNPDEIRYPEKIAYCRRNVPTETKIEVIKTYEQEFHFKILADRQDFKVDHFVPLCMGGSNNTVNLWPQHKSVYEITDPAEFELCQRLAQGSITQRDAVKKIKMMKLNIQKELGFEIHPITGW